MAPKRKTSATHQDFVGHMKSYTNKTSAAKDFTVTRKEFGPSGPKGTYTKKDIELYNKNNK